VSGPPAAASDSFGDTRDIGTLTSNALSLAVVACAGIAINSMLAHGFGVQAVGVFNQLLALHIVAAQFAAFGIHLSCLHYLSEKTMEVSSLAGGIRSATGAVAITGVLTGLLLFAAANLIEQLFNSPGLSSGVRWVAPAVAFFGLNKVLLAIFNARDRLHSCAFVQALRPVVWLAGTAALFFFDRVEPAQLGQLLLAGELAATVAGFVLLSPMERGHIHSGTSDGWFWRHLRFGVRAMPSNLILDLNTRIDVLVLGVFASDAVVGVYSFAAMLAEGVFQIGVLVRTVITRRLAGLLTARDQAGLSLLKRHAGGFSLGMTLAASAILAALLRPSIVLLGLDPALQDGFVALFVLLIGVSLCAMHSPFWMSLLLAGHPVEHSKLMLALCGLNLVLNLTLIPVFGLIGAAIGTAAMFGAFPLMLRRSAGRVLGMKL
jgi:O-antigen/teichoic acid export membrane protein